MIRLTVRIKNCDYLVIGFKFLSCFSSLLSKLLYSTCQIHPFIHWWQRLPCKVLEAGIRTSNLPKVKMCHASTLLSSIQILYFPWIPCVCHLKQLQGSNLVCHELLVVTITVTEKWNVDIMLKNTQRIILWHCICGACWVLWFFCLFWLPDLRFTLKCNLSFRCKKWCMWET